MSRYIDVEAIDWSPVEDVYGSRSESIVACEILIANQKVADVIEHKRGHWYWDDNGMDWNLGCWCCSECRMRNPYIGGSEGTFLLGNPYNWAGSKFCPNCGADMRGE